MIHIYIYLYIDICTYIYRVSDQVHTKMMAVAPSFSNHKIDVGSCLTGSANEDFIGVAPIPFLKDLPPDGPFFARARRRAGNNIQALSATHPS